MCKKCLLGVIGLFMAIAAFVVVVILTPAPGVTYGNYSRLEIGMPRANVEALLGPKIETPFEVNRFRERGGILGGPEWSGWENSRGDFVSVCFDDNGGLQSAWWNGWRDDRSGWQKLRDRLPWIGEPPPQMVFPIE
jgi:hypothetical protein